VQILQNVGTKVNMEVIGKGKQVSFIQIELTFLCCSLHCIQFSNCSCPIAEESPRTRGQ